MRHAPLDVGKSSGQAAKKLGTCGFSKWKHTLECFGNYLKNNVQIQSLFYERLLDERSGKFISVCRELDLKNSQAELNMKMLIPIFKVFFFFWS